MTPLFKQTDRWFRARGVSGPSWSIQMAEVNDAFAATTSSSTVETMAMTQALLHMGMHPEQLDEHAKKIQTNSLW